MLLIALVLDRIGEPPGAIHPVVWIGALIAKLERLAPSTDRSQLAYGALLAALPPIISAGVVIRLGRLTSALPRPLRLLAHASLLTWTFSMAGLERAAGEIHADLERNDLERARQDLRSLVSRPAHSLSDSEIAAAAIESLAENCADSIIAPLLWWRIGGLPAAAAYRAINTADAMVGYHGRYEYLGRAAARLDDLVNLVPARITALTIALTSGGSDAFRSLLRDRGRTESPNAGWPMAAMAGALGRRLEKTGHYVLGSDHPSPDRSDISRAIRIVRRATVFALLIVALFPRRAE